MLITSQLGKSSSQQGHSDPKIVRDTLPYQNEHLHAPKFGILPQKCRRYAPDTIE